MALFLNRPLTLAEFSSWMQLICAESAMVSRSSEQLTTRARKIHKTNESLAHRIHEAKQASKQLEQEIVEQQKAEQAVRDCLAEMEGRLSKLNEENALLNERVAELQQPSATGEGPLLTEEQVAALKKEQRKLAYLKRIINHDINKDNVADLLPAVMQKDQLERMVLTAASGVSSWDEILEE